MKRIVRTRTAPRSRSRFRQPRRTRRRRRADARAVQGASEAGDDAPGAGEGAAEVRSDVVLGAHLLHRPAAFEHRRIQLRGPGLPARPSIADEFQGDVERDRPDLHRDPGRQDVLRRRRPRSPIRARAPTFSSRGLTAVPADRPRSSRPSSRLLAELSARVPSAGIVASRDADGERRRNEHVARAEPRVPRGVLARRPAKSNSGSKSVSIHGPIVVAKSRSFGGSSDGARQSFRSV